MEEFKKYLVLRGSIYRMFALIFYKEPAEKDFARLKKYLPVFGELARGYENDEISAGIAFLDAFFSEYGEEEAVSVCGRHFTEIFLSTGLSLGKKSVVPQESVYLSPEHLSMQEPRDQVLEEYYKCGIGKESGFSEPEDHVSAELYFSAWLGDKLSDELGNGDGSQAEKTGVQLMDFTKKHLIRWVPAMCSDVERISPDKYYKGVALVARGFLRTDEHICGEAVGCKKSV